MTRFEKQRRVAAFEAQHTVKKPFTHSTIGARCDWPDSFTHVRCGRMKRFLIATLFLLFAAVLGAQDPAAEMEKTVAKWTQEPSVTIVHLWAPWCGNCKAEMTPNGWAKFIGDNPNVKVVFISIWHQDQDAKSRLAAGELGGQANFVSLIHPNAARKGPERLQRFLGQSITWVPTTWVFKDGMLHYALNYGEVRFPILQQLVNDAAADW